MIAFKLDEQRCENCHKLLFRGILGFAFIEVKCNRCGHVNLLNSYDTMLRGTPGAYIIVYDQQGKILAASKTTESILGYTDRELQGKHMHDIDHEFKLPSTGSKNRDEALDKWQKLHKTFPASVSHICADGSIRESNARYYPIGTFTGVYTMCVFYARNI